MGHLTFFRMGIVLLLLAFMLSIPLVRNDSFILEDAAFWCLVFGVLLLVISIIVTLWPVMA